MIQRLPLLAKTNVPAANAVVPLYDDEGNRNEATTKNRYRGRLRCDQGFSVRKFWSVSPTGPLRLISTTVYAGGVSGHILGTRAQMVITAVTVANIAAGGGTNDYFSVTYGSTTITYELKKDADFVVTAGRTTIDVSALTTAAEVATAIYARVHADFPTLSIAAPSGTTVTIFAAGTGTCFALTSAEHVANAGFTMVDTAGTDGTVIDIDHHLWSGRNYIDCVIGSSAPTEFEYVAETSDEPYPT